MTLLAYEEPEKSPVYELLSMDHRQNVADKLNRIVLGWLKESKYSGTVVEAVAIFLTANLVLQHTTNFPVVLLWRGFCSK